MNDNATRKPKLTVPDLALKKAAGERLSMVAIADFSELTAYINGQAVATVEDYGPRIQTDVTRWMQPGHHVLVGARRHLRRHAVHKSSLNRHVADRVAAECPNATTVKLGDWITFWTADAVTDNGKNGVAVAINETSHVFPFCLAPRWPAA